MRNTRLPGWILGGLGGVATIVISFEEIHQSLLNDLNPTNAFMLTIMIVFVFASLLMGIVSLAILIDVEVSVP